MIWQVHAGQVCDLQFAVFGFGTGRIVAQAECVVVARGSQPSFVRGGATVDGSMVA